MFTNKRFQLRQFAAGEYEATIEDDGKSRPLKGHACKWLSLTGQEGFNWGRHRMANTELHTAFVLLVETLGSEMLACQYAAKYRDECIQDWPDENYTMNLESGHIGRWWIKTVAREVMGEPSPEIAAVTI